MCALSLLLVAACGDDGVRTDGGATDAAMDAAPDAVPDGSVDAAADGAADATVDAADGSDAAAPSRIDAIVALLGDASASIDAVDAALEAVAVEARWPLVEDGRILFVTRWDDAPASVAVVSDINDWDESATPAAVAATGVHYYALFDVADASVPLEGAIYKWFGAPDVYRPPPEATAYGFDTFGAYGLVLPDRSVQHRERYPLRSAHLELLRTIRFLLPAGFAPESAAAASARVLLMHDGQNLFHPDAPFGGWRVDEALSAPGYEDVVVVAIDSVDDRIDAYTPVPDWLDDMGTTIAGGRADDYLALLEDEALPFARSRYGLTASKAQTVVGGSSLGGLVSLLLAIERPHLTRCVIAMSSTLFWGAANPALDGSDAIVNRWPAEVGHGDVAIYLDSGGNVTGTCVDTDGDGVEEEGDDFDNYCETTQLRDVLAGEGYVFDTDLFHWWEPDAMHDEAAWAARFPRALSACETAGW